MPTATEMPFMRCRCGVEGEGWHPIGDIEDPFTADFVADGYTISGMMIRRRSSDDVGLFGVISAATIRGLGMIGCGGYWG